MEGLLLVDKPPGWTSFDVVKYIRSLAAKSQNLPPKKIKVGHSGTLDPFATGLLIILVGRKYTSLASKFLALDKKYFAGFELGKVSTTGDPEGEISKLNSKIPTADQLRKALELFKGEIEQRPPAYSALKVHGTRAYSLARKGEKVKLEPRKVTIYELKLNSYSYPNVEVEASVSSGTYIRSLVEDIGAVLKTGAYTTALRRTAIGNYSIAAAHNLQQLNEQNIRSALTA